MNTKKKAVTIISIAIIILGVAILFTGLGEKFNFSGNYTSSETYGGDAYTGIQNAAADTSNNVKNLGDMLEEYLNNSYIFGGILLILVGAYLLVCNLSFKNEQESEKSPLPADKTTEQVSEGNVEYDSAKKDYNVDIEMGKLK